MHSVASLQFFISPMGFSCEEEWIEKPHTLDAAKSAYIILKYLESHKTIVKQAESLNCNLQTTMF